MDLVERFNVTVSGPEGAQPMLFAHGFGCDQNMWRYLVPRFEDRFRIVLFDYPGHGGSKLPESDADRYNFLSDYAEDLLTICGHLNLQEVIFIGHSVSSIIGVLAEIQEPDRFARLVLVAPSPRYIDDPPYKGGFSEADIDAPVSVGEFVNSSIPDSSLVLLDATGHCPHLSTPHATAAAISDFLGG